jgi:hypothetical protein
LVVEEEPEVPTVVVTKPTRPTVVVTKTTRPVRPGENIVYTVKRL